MYLNRATDKKRILNSKIPIYTQSSMFDHLLVEKILTGG